MFCGYIELCLSEFYTAVINNGNRLEFNKVTCGLKQGDPLSCDLFILTIEALGKKIRQEEDIEGITILLNVTKKQAQYADDLWLAIKHKEKCYKALFSILKAFTSFSRLKVNYNKTEILRIGSLRNRNARYYSELPLFWTDGPIKILGIWVLANRNEMFNRNWSDTMNKAENILRLWRKRSLTLLGKIMIINTLVVPLFTGWLLF